MPLHIRPFDPGRDYPMASRLLNTDPLEAMRSPGELELLHDKLPASCQAKSWIAEEAGEPIAYLGSMKAVWDIRRGGRLLKLHFAPSASLSALRSVYTFLLRECRQDKAEFLVVWTRDDVVRRVQFLSDMGFSLVKRHAVTRIEVDKFIPEPYYPKVELLKKRGVVFSTAKELEASGRDVKQMLKGAIDEVLREEYGFQGESSPPFEKFVRRAADSQSLAPDTSFLALHEGRLVGFTRLIPSEAEPDCWRTGLTGIVPSWRKRKLGTCLKVRSLVAAKDAGIKFIQTDNAEDNPTLHLNFKLGFERIATLLEFEIVTPKTVPKD